MNPNDNARDDVCGLLARDQGEKRRNNHLTAAGAAWGRSSVPTDAPLGAGQWARRLALNNTLVRPPRILGPRAVDRLS